MTRCAPQTNRARTQAGFTLIELLVVIAMLGIMSSIAASGYQGAQDNSRNAQVGANVHLLQTALELYAARYQNYPAGGLRGDNSGGPQFLMNINHATAPADDLGFMPGETFPESPWGQHIHQANNLALTASLVPTVGAPAAANGLPPAPPSTLGAGSMPTSSTFTASTYGAIMYDYDARKFYSLVGVGKVGRLVQHLSPKFGSTF